VKIIPDKVRRFSVDILADLGALILAVFLFVLASDYPATARRFPQLALILIICLSALDIIHKAWVTYARPGAQEEKQEEQGHSGYARGFYMVCLMFGFLVSMLLFGFALGTFVFLLFSAWSLGYRKTKSLILSSLIITGFMYVVFVLIMNSLLPQGLLFDILRG
jgi:hypothetical protein